MFIILTVATAAAAAQPGTVVAPVIPPRTAVVGLDQSYAPPPQISSVVRAVGEIYPSSGIAVAPVPVRVRVTAGGQQLFADTLRVSRNTGASFQQTRSDAPEGLCSGQRYYGFQDRYSLSINLYLREETPGITLMNVSVSWQRPSNTGCGGEGTRQVELSQTVPLAPGQSVTLQGDAGLVVTLSR